MADKLKKNTDDIASRLEEIREISLEDEDYNQLHHELVALRDLLFQVAKVRHKVRKTEAHIKEKESKEDFWDSMKKFRSPGEEFKLTEDAEVK